MILGILISGRGSNMEGIVRAVQDGRIKAEVGIVISSSYEASGLRAANRLGVRSTVVAPFGTSRAEYDERIRATLESAGVTPEDGLVCLAGFMRILGPAIITRYKDRIINIHPSLLPAFPGLSAQEQALDAGVRVSGCTVHLVDPGTDTGPIIEQADVPVRDGDTIETLSERVLAREHEIYPEVVARICDGRIIIRDGIVIRA